MYSLGAKDECFLCENGFFLQKINEKIICIKPIFENFFCKLFDEKFECIECILEYFLLDKKCVLRGILQEFHCKKFDFFSDSCLECEDFYYLDLQEKSAFF